MNICRAANTNSRANNAYCVYAMTRAALANPAPRRVPSDVRIFRCAVQPQMDAITEPASGMATKFMLFKLDSANPMTGNTVHARTAKIRAKIARVLYVGAVWTG